MEAPKSPEQEGIINNVRFVPIKKKDGTLIGWRSSRANMKSLELAPDSPITPVENVKYQVQAVSDTEPGDPMKGKLVVTIVKRQGRLLTADEWKEVEETVQKAEVPMRKSKAASREIYKLTGVPRKARSEPETRTEILQNMENVADQIIFQTAEDRENELELEAESILGDPLSAERVLKGFRLKNLAKALREHRIVQRTIAEHRKEEVHILASIKDAPTATQLEVLNEIRSKIAVQKDEIEKMTGANPEAFYGIHLSALKEYRHQLTRGRIVETPYVREKADDVVTHILAGKPVLIYGHLGSGKTELAMHVAKKYLGKEALVICGSKHTSLAELYGHQILAIDKIDKKDLDSFINDVERKYDTWVADHKNATDQEKHLAHDRILQTYLTHAKGGTVSDFFLGPIYKAMDEGRPIIIDEVNAIPHEVLISLNHILTRRPGETVDVQQDSGRKITIKPGFGILMTGNLNQGDDRYVDRQDMDPALLSRLYKLEYDYLPQKTVGTVTEADPKDELFTLLVSRLMDKNGDITVPDGSLSQLWKLAKVARVTQDLFAGHEVQDAMFKQGRDRPLAYFLKQSVLSIRSLDNIITQWQREGYRYELDEYIWKEFISQSTDVTERAFLYQLFHDRFGFFSGDKWDQNPDYGSGGRVTAFRITSPKLSAAKIETTGPRTTVETIFGHGPERTSWPSFDVAEEVEETTTPAETPETGTHEEQESVNELLARNAKTNETIRALQQYILNNQFLPIHAVNDWFHDEIERRMQAAFPNISPQEAEERLKRANIRIEDRESEQVAVSQSTDRVLFKKRIVDGQIVGFEDEIALMVRNVFAGSRSKSTLKNLDKIGLFGL
ncbi:hypothetical protein A3D73_02905 [Candidatus Uhrbacteria bacterium RIFCSPHIGHO2_02_FULL_60_44]|nr:MAG: hypothetical protein A3D73_02905 [Candidatus Uhrbacteria bacterium RIFCSPHIGHO2_02_FULL_60_44]